MDNNFDMSQENYIVSQIPNRPKKKKTGLIVGISIAVVALIAAIVAVVLIFVLGGGDDLEGTWSYTEEGVGVEMMFDGDGSGSMSMKYQSVTMLSFEFEYTYDEDTKILNMEVDESLGAEQSNGTYKVTKLTDDELVLETDDETLELKRVD